VLTFSSAAFPSFSILPCPYFCWILRQNRGPDESFMHRGPQAIAEDKVESSNFNLDFIKIIVRVVFFLGGGKRRWGGIAACPT
jgi:hypothetical protein